ncbi:MAG: MMPL family transporter [Solirubrobacteraceae bacterium]
MARHRRFVLLGWMLALIVCAALYPSLKGVLSAPDYSVDNSQSLKVERLLEQGLRGAGSEQDALVFYSRDHRATDPAYRAAVARVLRAARSQAGVVGVVGPYGGHGTRAVISSDRRAAVAQVALAGNARERFTNAALLQTAVGRADSDGVRAWLTGFSSYSKDIAQVETVDASRAEGIGIPVALVVLLLALGALAAAVVPLLTAGASLLLCYGVISILARIFDFDVFLLTIVTMIGLGIGIDYSLFVVSRFREELARRPLAPRAERRRIAEAVGASVASSGRTIAYSGIVVGLSLTSLLVVPAAVYREFVMGTLVTVICTVGAALTLLPAMLAQFGSRINAGSLPARLQPSEVRADVAKGEGGWARWALAVMRRPIVVACLISALLIVAMIPVLGLKYGIDVPFKSISQTPSGQGAAVLSHSFPPGLSGPIEVVVSGSGVPGSHASLTAARQGARLLVARLRHDRRVAGLALSSYAGRVLLMVTPAVSVDSPAAYALVRDIRAVPMPRVDGRAGSAVLVGGWTALSVDASNIVTGRLPYVLAITFALALMFLLIVFRSVVLPVKAILMNMLATGATLGLVALIFQDGHGESLLGFTSPGFVQSYLPMVMFVMLFGLSMDYEVFLIRRMQETWQATGDNRLAVASGVEHTARPISAAAAIMVAVFGSFMTANILELKQIGFALAAAVAIDATLIRLALVPALMCLLGSRNWWLPSGLERVLPRLDLD